MKERDKTLAQAIKMLGKSEFSGALSSFVKRLAAFDNLIVLVYNGEGNPAVLYREYRDPVVYRHMDSSYLAGAYQLDPFYHEHLRGAGSGLRRLVDVAPAQLQCTSYFTNYYQQTTLVDEVAVFADLGAHTTITACFGKDRSSGVAFSGEELKMLRSYENVLSSLLESQWKDVCVNRLQNSDSLPLGERFRAVVKSEAGIKLSPRQAEVATFILQGHSSVSIGLHLGISSETVKVFRRQLYAKCNISSQAELFALMMPLYSGLSTDN